MFMVVSKRSVHKGPLVVLYDIEGSDVKSVVYEGPLVYRLKSHYAECPED